MNFSGSSPLRPVMEPCILSLQLSVLYIIMSQSLKVEVFIWTGSYLVLNCWREFTSHCLLSKLWCQLCSSSFHLQSIRQKFLSLLCSSQLQEIRAVASPPSISRPGKGEKSSRSRRTSSCPSGRDAIRRPGLHVAMTCPDEKSRLSPAQPHLQQVGSAGAVVGHGGGFLQVPLQLPGTAQWAVLALTRVTSGYPELCFKTSHKKKFIKKWLKEITLKKECVCPTRAGVLYGS